MALQKISLNTQHLSLYVDTEQGMVFHHIKQSLYQLPALSVAILLAIDEGWEKSRALETVAEISQLSVKQLTDSYLRVEALLSQERPTTSYLDGRYPELKSALNGKKIATKENAHTYQVANASFSIASEFSALHIEIAALLKQCNKTLTEVDFEITIEQQLQVFYIFCNGLPIEQGIGYNQVVPLIIDRLQILAFQKSDYCFCFHGAALQSPEGNLLLPGKSGTGKSTLSATLADQQNRLYSDEIIALNKDFQLCILPLPIAVKSGSWDILQSQYPELSTAPAWYRLDGRQLKYVWPQAFAKHTHNPNKEKTRFLLVNPNYRSTTDKANLLLDEPLSKSLGMIETISMLTQSGYQLGVELTAEKLEQFIDFIAQNRCYQIFYNSSEQAKQQLRTLWQNS